MASNFVPMLSASPPPLDDCPDDDEDDFGNFTSANIPFDSSFDSPVSSDKHKPFKSGDNGVNDIGLNNDFNRFCSFSESNMAPQQNHVHGVTTNQISNSNNIEHENDDLEESCFDSSRNCISGKCKTPINSKIILSSVPDGVCDAPESPTNSVGSFDEPRSFPKLDLNCCSIDENISEDKVKLETADDRLNDVENSSNLIPVSSVEAVEFEAEFSSHSITNGMPNVAVNPHGLFNNSFVDCDEASESAQSSDISPDCVKESINASENLEFPVDFSAVDDFDDYDGFQQADYENAQSAGEDDNLFDESSIAQKTIDEFETDFSHFQQSEDCGPRDSDDFDDFQSFGKADKDLCIKNKLENCDKSEDFSDEEFQSFKKCDPTVTEAEDFDDFQGCAVASSSTTQSFANFDDKGRSGSPEFADFESASFSSKSDETPAAYACSSSDKNVDKISTVLSAIFPSSSESAEEVSCEQHSEILKQSNKSHRLWEKLHEVEQTPGLRFQWGVSHSFQQLLRSVNVDYHSILRTSSVPIFATSLSLLEPVKGQTTAASAEFEDRIQSPRDPIPPVEFDWTSSGLVNPLDCGLAASALMDISFLAATDTATSSSNSDHSFENELLKPSPAPPCSENTSKTMILEELLSKNVCSLPNSRTSHRPTKISPEANSVLDQLPNLSFMRAKVLMFPISNQT